MLQAGDIHFCIGQRAIIRKANLCVAPGSFTAILGPNGAGKSSLLKILTGDLNCPHGYVSFNGKNIRELSANELSKIRAVMPQHTFVTFPFRVREVVELGLLNSNVKAPACILDEVMNAVNVSHLDGVYYGDLSGGEKQRVQLARVLAQIWAPAPYPRYLLLDEPSSSLDIGQQHAIMQAVSRLKSKNIGILAIIHDLNLALAYADQLIWMKEGEVLEAGSATETLREDLLGYIYDHPVRLMHDPVTQKPIVLTSPSLDYFETENITA
jgi:iron complex transport system ATP-binding protein